MPFLFFDKAFERAGSLTIDLLHSYRVSILVTPEKTLGESSFWRSYSLDCRPRIQFNRTAWRELALYCILLVVVAHLLQPALRA